MLHLLPPDEQKETYDKFVYESGRAASEIGYWVIAEPGWREIAEYVAGWLEGALTEDG